MTDSDDPAAHYNDSSKLAVRGGFHARYSNVNWFAWVDARLNIPGGARVLDVGCGPGWFWAACQHLPDDMILTLLDQSAHMVEQATARLKHLRVAEGVVADAKALPFSDNSFDVVVAMHMLYHLPDPAAALGEIHRVLVPGGRCIVTTNSPRNLPQVADLSRQAFGTAIDDMVQARFGTAVALDMMERQFADVMRWTYEDIYQVDDPAPVIEMLLTMPPGDQADQAGKDRLRHAVDDLMIAHEGVVPMPVAQDMISGIKAP